MKQSILLLAAFGMAAFAAGCGDDDSREGMLNSFESSCYADCDTFISCNLSDLSHNECRSDCREMTLYFAAKAPLTKEGDACIKSALSYVRCSSKLSCSSYESFLDSEDYRHECGDQERAYELRCSSAGVDP